MNTTTSPSRKPKQFDLYQQAIEQAQAVVDSLDQLHSMLKDLKLDQDVESGTGPYRLSIRKLVSHAEGLREQLETAECAECQCRLLNHNAEDGCQTEHADGKCACRWGSEELRNTRFSPSRQAQNTAAEEEKYGR